MGCLMMVFNFAGSDFRISTSCGGPILLPVSIKPPKPTDLQLPAGDYVIFVSIHQARYLSTVHMGMVPFFLDEMERMLALARKGIRSLFKRQEKALAGA